MPCPWDSPGKNTGVGCHALLQGIFPTQGSNPGLMSPALVGEFFTTSATWETLFSICVCVHMHVCVFAPTSLFVSVCVNRFSRVQLFAWIMPVYSFLARFFFFLMWIVFSSLSWIYYNIVSVLGFPGGSVVTNTPTNAGDQGSIPGSERSTGEETGNPLQYSCLENPMDRGAWWATVHTIAKSQTSLSD